MILSTDELREQLLANGRQQDVDHAPVVKFFNPPCEGVWLATELDADGDTLYGLADSGEPELGGFLARGDGVDQAALTSCSPLISRSQSGQRPRAWRNPPKPRLDRAPALRSRSAETIHRRPKSRWHHRRMSPWTSTEEAEYRRILDHICREDRARLTPTQGGAAEPRHGGIAVQIPHQRGTAPTRRAVTVPRVREGLRFRDGLEAEREALGARRGEPPWQELPRRSPLPR